MSSESGKTLVYVVPHTHWDRAWYVPFEEFRYRLLGMIKELCRTLETDPGFRCFTLDGQAIVLEDYLDIHPEHAARLEALIRARRLFVGPWYVLPDEFLVSAESLVRNLLYGRRLANRFGHTMNVGYVPDSFGHIAQLPQILRGFDMDSFIFFRGVDQSATKLNIEFLWCGLDGSTVLASQQRPFYGNGTHLGYTTNWGDTEGMVQGFRLAVEQVDRACRLLREHSVARTLLLGNGIDQSAHQSELPKMLRRLARHFPQYRFKIGSFEDYVAALKRDVDASVLQVHEGELLYAYGDLLRGVNSSRMYMKLLNQESQDLLEKWAEPIAATAWLTRCASYPQQELLHAWRELMKTHPHDDVCSASIDQVHREGETRLAAVQQVGGMVYRTTLRRLALNLDNTAQPGVPVIVFNTLAAARKEVVRIEVDLNPFDEPWDSLSLFDEKGRAIPSETIAVRRAHWWEAIKPFDVQRHSVEFEADLPVFGYRTVYARKGRPSPVKPRIKASARRFENECCAFGIGANGAITLVDKTTKKRYPGLLVFEDTEDCGDEYNWSYLAQGSETYTTARSKAQVTLLHRGPFSATWRITHVMRLPKGLTASRKARSRIAAPLEIVSEVTGRAGSPRVDVVTRVRNTIKDHRLRVLFPTPVSTDVVHVDGHFGVIARNVFLPPAKENMPPYPTQHQLRFADLNDGRAGFAIINDGMPEFEVVCAGDNRTLAQTLFRAVGWLGRDDFPTRPFSPSPMIVSPEAQCLRSMEFRYAFMAHAGGWEPVMQESLRHNIDVCVSRCDIHGGTDLRQMGIKLDDERAAQKYKPVPRGGKLPDHGFVMDVGNESLILSAFKKAEHGASLIVRVYNPGKEPVTGVLRMLKPIQKAWLTDLSEKRLAPLPLTNGVLPYRCEAYRIMTFALKLSSS